MTVREHPGDVIGSNTAVVDGYTERTIIPNQLHIYNISRPFKVTFGTYVFGSTIQRVHPGNISAQSMGICMFHTRLRREPSVSTQQMTNSVIVYMTQVHLEPS